MILKMTYQMGFPLSLKKKQEEGSKLSLSCWGRLSWGHCVACEVIGSALCHLLFCKEYFCWISSAPVTPFVSILGVYGCIANCPQI